MSLEKRVAAIEQKLGISPSANTGPIEAASANTGPVEAASANTGPVEAASANTGPVEAASANTGPVEAASANTAPVEAASANTAPVEAASANTAPVEAASANTAPVEAASAVTAPVEAAIPASMDTSPAMLPPSTNTSTVPDSTIISLNGYNGTIKDLSDKIAAKITNLNSPSNKGKYKNRVDELRNLLGNLKKATTVQDIQSTIGSKLSFKNNNLMGGKTKRRGRKTKKSNKSKRR